MKKTVMAMAISLAVLLLPTTGHAQWWRTYAGGGIGMFRLKYSDASVSQRSTVAGGFGRLGIDVNPYIGVELRVGTLASSEKYYTGTTTRRKLSTGYFLSDLIKLQYPVDVGVNLYALIGGTRAKFKLTTNRTNVSVDTAGLSYGAGLDYTVQDDLSAGIEWVQYWNNVKLGSAFGTNARATIAGAVAHVAYHF